MKRVPQPVQHSFDTFWKPLVTGRFGCLSKRKVMCELADYETLMEVVPEVYMAVTDNRMSKTTYTAKAVIQQFEEYLDRLRTEWLDDLAAALAEHGWDDTSIQTVRECA